MNRTTKILKATGSALLLCAISGTALADNNPELLAKADTSRGENLYNTTCVACHGPSGKGLIPGVPDFRGQNSRLINKDMTTLLHNVGNGFQSPGNTMAMPPKGGNPTLTQQDLVDILAYMRKTFPPESS